MKFLHEIKKINSCQDFANWAHDLSLYFWGTKGVKLTESVKIWSCYYIQYAWQSTLLNFTPTSNQTVGVCLKTDPCVHDLSNDKYVKHLGTIKFNSIKLYTYMGLLKNLFFFFKTINVKKCL